MVQMMTTTVAVTITVAITVAVCVVHEEVAPVLGVG